MATYAICFCQLQFFQINFFHDVYCANNKLINLLIHLDDYPNLLILMQCSVTWKYEFNEKQVKIFTLEIREGRGLKE